MEHGVKREAYGAWRKGIFSFLTPASCLLIPAVFLLTSVQIGCAPQQQKITAPQDKPLAAFQTDLLQTAFDVAAAIPVYPHIKDRSRAQEAVVTASLDLDQPIRALSYIDQIGNWRRGSGYADYAFYCVQNGFTHDVQTYLDLADKISLVADQDWRRDRIKVRIAQTHLLMGRDGLSEQFSANIEESESGKVEQVEARLCSAENFDEMFSEVQALVNTGHFDSVKNALYAFTELFNRFYNDPERRAQVEQAIRDSWNPMPLFIRIELLEKLTGFALDHGDASSALELIGAAQTIMDDADWPLDYDVPASARRAALRFRAGDPESALSELGQTLERFNTRQGEVVDIYRSQTLLPVAEAFKTAGDAAMALTVYKQALESAVINPNSRPRAEDLSAICISMAVNGVEPDEALWSRIREIQANLGDPW